MTATALLDVRDLTRHFGVVKGLLGQSAVSVRAVDGISFTIDRGETPGLVGEWGCGKSTAGRAILQLHRPSSGEVLFNGKDLMRLKDGEMRRMRRQMQMIFQDPYASLNPRMTVAEIVAQPMVIHNLLPRGQRDQRGERTARTGGLETSRCHALCA